MVQLVVKSCSPPFLLMCAVLSRTDCEFILDGACPNMCWRFECFCKTFSPSERTLNLTAGCIRRCFLLRACCGMVRHVSNGILQRCPWRMQFRQRHAHARSNRVCTLAYFQKFGSSFNVDVQREINIWGNSPKLFEYYDRYTLHSLGVVICEKHKFVPAVLE